MAESARYWAFISYSHKDVAFARRLHRRLERYTLPRRLVGRATALGPVPRRLVPIFRDREELPAANDLTTEVRAALQASRSLIVVCSPHGAASNWVSQEVQLFRALHPGRPVLAAICDGEPGESMPEALRMIGAGGETIEPLAADFRRGRDGAQLGLLKLVAGIVGVGLDELVQRDSNRRVQRVTAVTVLALAAMLMMGALTVFALNARMEAERQRTAAEGLVQFMLTDLRDRLKGVGRLDVMAAVNERALHYYDHEIDSLPPASLEQRAQVLQAIGDDDETRGDHGAAMGKFQEAWRTTHTLLAEAPEDPNRIFNQAQSEYWIGYDAYERGQFATAKGFFGSYKKFVERLVSIAPNNPIYLRELAYAEGDLCSLSLQPPREPAAALKSCLAALGHMEAAAHRLPASSGIDSDLVNRHSWLATAYAFNGNDRDSLTQLLIKERILDGLMKSDPLNMEHRTDWIALQRRLAQNDLRTASRSAALSRLRKAETVLDQMIAFDPSNTEWAQRKTKLESDIRDIASTPQKGSQQ